MGIGAIVEVFSAGKLGSDSNRLGAREVTVGYGYASGQMPMLHFGLGDVTQVDIRAKLPDGTTIERLAVQSSQKLHLQAE